MDMLTARLRQQQPPQQQPLSTAELSVLQLHKIPPRYSNKEIAYDQVYQEHFESGEQMAQHPEYSSDSQVNSVRFRPSVTQTALDSAPSFGISSIVLSGNRVRSPTRDALTSHGHDSGNPSCYVTRLQATVSDSMYHAMQTGDLTRQSASSVESGITTNPSQKPSY